MSVPATLTPRTALLLLLPPMLWAGNAITGRLVHELIPPMTLNFVRWLLAMLVLLPLAHRALARHSPLWSHWKRYALLGLLGVGCYNSLQYLALQTSTPINVTLVASSTPIFMLGIGALFFGQRVQGRQMVGTVLSVGGVVLVMSRGSWETLAQVQLVPGDIFVLIATAAWAWYSWLLTQTDRDPPEIRGQWAHFLMAQIAFGLVWSGGFTVTEWQTHDAHIVWGWPLALALLYVSVGPSIVAYRAWGLGVQRVGPAIAGFFGNLTPLFAATFSALALGELPRTYHLIAFVMIVGGIVVSSRR